MCRRDSRRFSVSITRVRGQCASVFGASWIGGETFSARAPGNCMSVLQRSRADGTGSVLSLGNRLGQRGRRRLGRNRRPTTLGACTAGVTLVHRPVGQLPAQSLRQLPPKLHERVVLPRRVQVIARRACPVSGQCEAELVHAW
jgi:hypothetical protein